MSEKFRIPAQLLISYWDENIQISIFQKNFVTRRTFEGRWLPAGVGRGLLERDGGEQWRTGEEDGNGGMAWNGGGRTHPVLHGRIFSSTGHLI